MSTIGLTDLMGHPVVHLDFLEMPVQCRLSSIGEARQQRLFTTHPCNLQSYTPFFDLLDTHLNWVRCLLNPKFLTVEDRIKLTGKDGKETGVEISHCHLNVLQGVSAHLSNLNLMASQ